MVRATKNLLLILVACGTISATAPTWADGGTMIALNLGALHCPFTSGFAAVVLQPNPESGFRLLQCKNATGSSYYSELNDFAVRVNDPMWFHVRYPEAWVCFGQEPEDCLFYK